MTTTPILETATPSQKAVADPVVTGYVSSDGRWITDFDGTILGAVRGRTRVRLARWSAVHGSHITHFQVLMSDGVLRYGRSSEGIVINLHAVADQKSGR